MRTAELDQKLDEIGISNRQSISEAADKIMAALESLDLSDDDAIAASASKGRVQVVIMNGNEWESSKVVSAELLDGEWHVSAFDDYINFMIHDEVKSGAIPEEMLKQDGETTEEYLERRNAWLEQSMKEDECK